MPARTDAAARPRAVRQKEESMAHGALRQVVTGVRCLVCGCDEVRTDEVLERELIFLAECPRCDYRWTSRAGKPRVRIVALRSAPAAQEDATAA
jgi:hypothetical protein